MKFDTFVSVEMIRIGLMAKWLTRRSAKPLCEGSTPSQASTQKQSKNLEQTLEVFVIHFRTLRFL